MRVTRCFSYSGEPRHRRRRAGSPFATNDSHELRWRLDAALVSDGIEELADLLVTASRPARLAGPR